ncbi:MAG: sulfatase [Pseudomonadota bacterium]
MKTVFLLFDSLNRRALSCYGADTVTPNFQRLADRGITFDNHYVGSLPCMPARRDLQTGRLNFMHRSWGPLEPFDQSVSEILKTSGTYSHLITDHYHYFEEGGLNYQNRFSSWELERGQEWDPWKALVKAPFEKFKKQYHPMQFEEQGGRARGMINRHFVNREEDYSISRTFQRGIEFLDQNRTSDNWFLQLECFDPHEPFAAPTKYREHYPTGYNGPILDWPRYKRVEETEVEIAEIRANYAALVTMCDAYLGKLLDYFDANDLWRDTALIVTTDHGFMLAEHDWWAKSRMPFYNEIAQIPLLIYSPVHAHLNGQRRTSISQNIDIMPTLLDLHGAQIPNTVTGHSLRATLEDDTPMRHAAIYGQFGAATNVTDGRYTYFRYPEHIADQEIFEYTLMPTHQQSPFAVEEFEGAALVEGFGFMRGYPVLKLPARAHPRRGQGSVIEDTTTTLYDLENDPGQIDPINDKEVEHRLSREISEALSRHEAPNEAFTRLGL